MRSLLRGGTVVDGEGASVIRADVLIEDRRITAVGTPMSEDLMGVEILDVTGKIVCPGFIDVHSHDDLAVIRDPTLDFKVSQGVTTVIVGNCGFGVAPVGGRLETELTGATGTRSAVLGTVDHVNWTTFEGYLDVVESLRPTPNVAALAGHNTLRLPLSGDIPRPLTAGERTVLQERLDEVLASGALGMSSGLIYSPGRGSDLDELIALGEVLAGYGKPYVSHIRDEADGVEAAVDEALEIGRRTGVSVHISHLKAAGRANWGKMPSLIEAMARYRGATADVYPYLAASTSLGEAMAAGGSTTPTPPSDIVLAYVPSAPELEGRSLEAAARYWQVTPAAAAERVIAMPGGASVVYFVMNEDDLVEAIRAPLTMVGSDGLPTLAGKPHPRLWGTFTRFIRRYVLDNPVLSMPEAVRRMTSLPADTFGIASRGRVAAGNFADLVVFDPGQVRDRATYEEPHQHSAGITHVLVNGAMVWSQDAPTGNRAGSVLPHGAPR